MKKVFGAIGLGMLGVMFVASPAFGAVYVRGDEYSLKETETVEGNLYAGGGNIVLSGAVTGDAITAGGKVLIQGRVGGDVAAAGGNVDVLGPITGDLRVAGGQVTIGSKVNGDLVAFGGTIHVLSSAEIAGDVVMAGGRLVLDGTVRGDVELYGSEIVLNGRIDGATKAQATKAFVLGGSSLLIGNLDYRAPETAPNADEKVTGTVTFTPGIDERAIREGVTGAIAAAIGLFFLVKFFGTILVAVLATVFWSEPLLRITERGATSIGKSILIGFAFLVAVPIACILLIATLIGIIPAMVLLTGYMFLLLIAKIYTGILAGALMYQWWKGNIRISGTLAVVGTAAVTVVGFVPFLGPLVQLMFFLAALGIFVRELYGRLPSRRIKTVSTSETPESAS